MPATRMHIRRSNSSLVGWMLQGLGNAPFDHRFSKLKLVRKTGTERSFHHRRDREGPDLGFGGMA